MPAAADREGPAVVHLRARPVLFAGQRGQRSREIQLREGPRECTEGGTLAENCITQGGIETFLDLERLRSRREDAAFEVAQFGGGEAQRVGCRLPVDEALGARQHLLGMGRGGFDEIAQHVVVPDLERADPGFGGVLGLHAGDHAAPLVAQAPCLVEAGVEALRDEAAVACEVRRLGHQCRVEQRVKRLEPGQRRKRLAEKPGDRGARAEAGQRLGLGQRLAHGGKVAGAAPLEAQPRQCAVDVGHLPQRPAKRLAQGPVLHQRRHRVVAPSDLSQIARGRREPPLQQASAAGGDGAVDRVEQGVAAPPRKALREFERAARRGVDLHRAVQPLPPRRPQQGELSALGEIEIVCQRTQRRELGAREAAEPVERADLVERGKAALCGGTVEAGTGERRDLATGILRAVSQARLGGFREQQLARGQPRKLGPEPHRGAGHHLDLPGRDVAPGQCAVAAHLREAGQIVVPPRFQQRVLGERSGGDEAHDLAAHHGLRSALLRFGGVFHLLAHRDAEALADEREQVVLGGVDGHAAHRDVRAAVLAALGERDVERLGRGHGIVEEHLVEVAHPVEEQRIGMRALDLQILRHHRRDGVRAHAAVPLLTGVVVSASSRN